MNETEEKITENVLKASVAAAAITNSVAVRPPTNAEITSDTLSRCALRLYLRYMLDKGYKVPHQYLGV